MTALALALHILGAVVWVGGMFAAYMCLRPATGPLEPSARLKLWSAFFQKFLPWVWAAVLLLLASGYAMMFMTFGGFAMLPLCINLMQGLGWVMIALFIWLFHGPWLKLKRAVAASDWPTAGANLNRIRQIIAVNLPLGLLVVIIGASGRYWGWLFVELDGRARPLEVALVDVSRHVELRILRQQAGLDLRLEHLAKSGFGERQV